jgi:hypothetical protein
VTTKPTGSYVPPPPPETGYIHIEAPVDSKGRKRYPNLRLTPDDTEDLIAALQEGLEEYVERG